MEASTTSACSGLPYLKVDYLNVDYLGLHLSYCISVQRYRTLPALHTLIYIAIKKHLILTFPIVNVATSSVHALRCMLGASRAVL